MSLTSVDVQQNIVLVLDQTSIQGYDQRVTASQDLPDKDLSADSSSTSVAEGGIKPTKLSVTLKIRYTDKLNLKSLVNLSRSVDDQGVRRVYQVINQTAQAYNVRQARFTERVRAAELSDQQAWQVTFTLLEHNSVPERTEDRQQTSSTTNQPSSDGTPTNTTNSAGEQGKVYTGVMKWLHVGNEMLRPDEDDAQQIANETTP